MSTSSGSGRTATVAVEVWIRPCASVSGTRWTRWTPLSNWRWRKAPSPATLNETSRKPPSSVGLEVEHLELPAHLLGEPPVHLVEVAGEQGGLVAAGARPDLDDQGGVAGPGAAVVEHVAQDSRPPARAARAAPASSASA